MSSEPLNPFQPPGAADAKPAREGPADDWVRRYRRLALMLVVASSFAEGLITPSSSTGGVLVAMILASAITLWCGLDARLHEKLFLRSFGWLLMFTWPFGVGVYFVWTRGAKGIFTYIAFGFVCVVAAVAGAAVAVFVMLSLNR